MNTITVNGKEMLCAEPRSITQLLIEVAINPDLMAIEHNGEIIPREKLADTTVKPGDTLEIIQFVGGG